jgi:hypothetical protein
MCKLNIYKKHGELTHIYGFNQFILFFYKMSILDELKKLSSFNVYGFEQLEFGRNYFLSESNALQVIL